MQLLDAGQALASRPAPLATVSPGWANNAPASSPPTIADPDTINAIMAELIQFLTAASLTPSKTNVAQVMTACLMLFGAYGLDSGTNPNAYIITPALPIPALQDGQRVTFFTARANGAAATLQVGALAAQPVVNGTGGALGPNAITPGPNTVYWNAGLASFVVPTPFRLTANLTIYVATTGSDGNSGLASSSPFLTLQKAVVFAQSLNANGFSITISVAAGTYNAGVALNGAIPGLSSYQALQFVTTGGTVTINGSGACFSAASGAGCLLNGNFTLTQTNLAGSADAALLSTSGATIGIGGAGLAFGAAQGSHLVAATGGQITNVPSSSYSISGAATRHWYAQPGGNITIQQSATITLSGSPAFTTFATAIGAGAEIDCAGLTFSGGATGQRFSSSNNAVINTGGGGASYLPGSTAGSGSNAGASPYGLYV